MKLLIVLALAPAWPHVLLAQAPSTQILIEQMHHGEPPASALARELLRETAGLHPGDYRLLQPLAGSADSTARLEATEILGSMGVVNADVVQLLIPRLRDSVRSVCLAALGAWLTQRLLDPEPSVRASAADALNAVPSPLGLEHTWTSG